MFETFFQSVDVDLDLKFKTLFTLYNDFVIVYQKNVYFHIFFQGDILDTGVIHPFDTVTETRVAECKLQGLLTTHK